MKENRDFKGVWIPKEIWLNTDLSIIEKVLLVEIDSLDNSERGCFASNEYLAKFVQLSEGRVANIISDLKKRKFIIQVFFDGRNRGLRINKSESCFHENVNSDLTKTVKQTTRKREHNNTVNNTINNTDYNSSQTQFDTQNKEEIKNPFTRKKLDDLNARNQKEKEKSSAKKEKEKPEREPTELYQAYEIFCNFHESVSAAKYPRNFNGSFVINSIDGRNIKLLLQWIKTVSADNPFDNFLAFIKGVWALQDKYINTNFNIGLIYRQSTALYARIQNQNPVLNKQRREEQLNEEAAEFLRKRYGIVN
jgi:flagellar biosynthesis GTPase FlhF